MRSPLVTEDPVCGSGPSRAWLIDDLYALAEINIVCNAYTRIKN
jgi:hypothetical protein